MKYCNIIPLIGGMTIGNKQATGQDPEFIVSWSAFSQNDSHIVNNLQEVPYHIIDNDQTDVDISAGLRESYKGKIDFVSSVCPSK